MDQPRRILFAASIFLSAFLLFQVQPILARLLLPLYGGTPMVWTTCVLFFQAALLAGYAYAHWLGSRSAPAQAAIHVAVLLASLAFLPIALRHATASGPVAEILFRLTLSVGMPYFVLSATTPLLQRWFSLAQHGSPWRLYALSNFGSFLALLSYPFAVEPWLRLGTQSVVWSLLYAVFAVLCGWSALSIRSSRVRQPREAGSSPPLASILVWLGLAASASTLLLAVTNQISQEIAVNPFLWVAPLAVYLLSFVLTFESRRWYRRGPFAIGAGLLAAITCGVLAASGALSLGVQFAVYMAALFAVCMLCHGELAESRPEPRHLTAFYLTVAAGGVTGGVFVAVIAPRIFTEFSEFPIALGAACVLGVAVVLREKGFTVWTRGGLLERIPILALLLGAGTAVAAVSMGGTQPVVARARNFYGILRVTEERDSNGALRKLTHGRTYHGFEYLDPDKRDWPTMYYGPHSGAAITLNALPGERRRFAVIGLGTGTLALWGRSGDTIRFYEINPAVIDIAHQWFSFLKDSRAHVEIVTGDGRLELDRDPQVFDAIAVDAFSSDSIPVHLLTVECADIYRRHLKPDGVLLFHVTNRVLDLRPVVRGMAEHLGWKAAIFTTGGEDATGESFARWILLTPNAGFLEQRAIDEASSIWPRDQPPLTWTDDFSSLWQVLEH